MKKLEPLQKCDTTWSEWIKDNKSFDRVRRELEKEMAAYLDDTHAVLQGQEGMGKPRQMFSRELDWLAVAIGRMGGIGKAAVRLKVSRQTIYNWLEQGIGTLDFNRIVQIAQAGDVPLEFLARRRGPWRD